jgi:hypothetical protein
LVSFPLLSRWERGGRKQDVICRFVEEALKELA